jgi:hypothetical protein
MSGMTRDTQIILTIKAEHHLDKAVKHLNEAIELLGVAVIDFKKTKKQFADMLAIKELNPTYFENEAKKYK